MGFTMRKKKRGASKPLRPQHRVVKKKNRSAVIVACVVAMSFISSILLAIFIAIGCVSSSTFVNQLDLFTLRTNDTFDIQLGVGYFGGCVSVANQSGNELPIDAQRHCVANMRVKDLEDLNEELWEDLQLSDAARAHVKTSLNTTLTQAVHYQRDVFPWAMVALQPVLFAISGIMLFVALTASSRKRSYKAVLLVAILLGAFAIALAFVVAIGSMQALNALLDGDDSKTERMLPGGVFLRRHGALRYCQAAGAATTAIFYASIGALFVRRKSQGANHY